MTGARCLRRGEYRIDGGALRGRGHRSRNQMQVQSESLNPDRRRLELRSAGLWIGRVDRQHVGIDLVGKVEGHERKAGAETAIEANRGEDGTASRDDADTFAFADAEPFAVFRREIDGLAEAQRRRIAA